mmetsp:Transcript_22068/g.54590  ORF Transcript_22068/g.54590 Transcript_22068/m.54590 type:complete len:468 (+) Transcript_22068:95-1498(+)
MGFFFHIAILALSVFGYRFYSFYSKYYDSTPCSKDSPIEIEGAWFLEEKNYSLEACSLFSTDYFEAREKFRNAVKKYNRTFEKAELWSSLIVDDLTMDVAVLPGKQELGTIVHSSGVHGIEGYAGSSIQLALLELFSLKEIERPTIVMVHAVNPVGMKEYRRCNENNVDLNRNGIVISDLFPTFQDFVKKRDPNLSGYETFRSIFVPQMDINRKSDDLPLWDSTVGFFSSLILALIEHGFPALKKGIVSGQYHHPEGLNYGGKDFETPVQTLFDTFVKERPEFFRDSPHVVWIDAHTGLGPFGKDSVVRETHVEYPEGTTSLDIDSHFKTAFSVTSRMDGGKGTAQAFEGYDASKGFLTEFLGDAYRKTILEDEGKKTGIFILQEFGTIPSIFVGRALILDNMLYNFRKKRHVRKIQNGEDEPFVYRSPILGYAFYPQSTFWRNSIVRRGVALVLESIEYSKARSKQ